MELNQSEKMLFALLCSALNTIPVNSALFADVSLLSWQSCYKLAVEQPDARFFPGNDPAAAGQCHGTGGRDHPFQHGKSGQPAGQPGI